MAYRHGVFAAVLLCGVALSSCGSDDAGDTLLVPDDYPTIQAAVDASRPGDLVLIEPGVYRESVTVTTNDIVIRGVDRNGVILDGEYVRSDGIRVTGADGVAVENMTARNFLVNGFYWTDVSGYRGSYLTAVRNGYYGIYAYGSRGGLFENSFATGSYDAGFYIGRCAPCDAVITDSIAELNGLGYSGTNASVNLVVARSEFRRNRVGIMSNSSDHEKTAPQRDAVFVANLVHSNGDPAAPAFPDAAVMSGNGIVIAGGIGNLVLRNKVWNHAVAGIAVIPNVSGTSFPSRQNVVKDNIVAKSRMADLAIAESESSDNCFARNTFSSSMPRDIETIRPCSGRAGAGRSFFPIADILKRPLPILPNVSTVPDPPAQPSMPNARSRSRLSASATPPTVDLDRVPLPDPAP